MNLTQKQHAFVLAYLETGNASEAYRRSYNTERMKPETVNRAAKEMIDNPKISARIEELRAPALEKTLLSLDTHLAELAELKAQARDLGQITGAIRAEELRGRAAGLYVERKRHEGPDGGPIQQVHTLSVGPELIAAITEILEKL